MKTKAIILLILLAPAFFSCKSSNKNIEKKPSIELWDYETAWGIKERMIVDPQFPRHNYDFKKLNIISRKSGQKIPKIANLQYYKSKANYGTKKKGISR